MKHEREFKPERQEPYVEPYPPMIMALVWIGAFALGGLFWALVICEILS